MDSYLRDNARGSCSGENPEDNMKVNEVHWLVAAEKFPELLSPVTALLKQPQQAVEEVPAMMRVLLPRQLRVTRCCRRV